MKIRIRTYRAVCMFSLLIIASAVSISELCILAYLSLNDWQTPSVLDLLWLGCIVPVLAATPASIIMGRMGHDLSGVEQELTVQAETDDLTGLLNRRSFLANCDRALEAAQVSGESLALLIIDADHFKQINDHYGHAVGDVALKSIADQLRGAFRRTDHVCRLGGEEFAVLLAETDTETAIQLAERVVKQVGRSPISDADYVLEVTISCGYADTTIGYDRDALLRAADDALYQAKASGRNRVVPYEIAA